MDEKLLSVLYFLDRIYTQTPWHDALKRDDIKSHAFVLASIINEKDSPMFTSLKVSGRILYQMGAQK